VALTESSPQVAGSRSLAPQAAFPKNQRLTVERGSDLRCNALFSCASAPLLDPIHKSRARAAAAIAAAGKHLRINARRAVMRKCLPAAAQVSSRRRSCPALSCRVHQSSSVGVRGTSQISDPAPLIRDCKPERLRRVHCIWFVGRFRVHDIRPQRMKHEPPKKELLRL
jgi:hypothetical protein